MPMLPWIKISDDRIPKNREDFRIDQVSEYLKNSTDETIDPIKFRMACEACHINPSSFSREDLELLKIKTERTAG